MASDFWFKFYFKDWADDVKPLSLTARGLLIELIIHLRKNEGEMPCDIRLISRLTGGLSDEITGGLREFRENLIFDFEKRGEKEFLISRKIKKEIHISLTNRLNGEKGGNPTLKNSVNPSDNRGDNRPSNSIFNSDSEFKNENNSGQNKSGESFETMIWPTFDDFWEAYGKKVDRKACEKKWGKLDQPTKEKIMQHIEAYVKSTPDISFRRNPETYLNNESWNNEIVKNNSNGKQTSTRVPTDEIFAAVNKLHSKD